MKPIRGYEIRLCYCGNKPKPDLLYTPDLGGYKQSWTYYKCQCGFVGVAAMTQEAAREAWNNCYFASAHEDIISLKKRFGITNSEVETWW